MVLGLFRQAAKRTVERQAVCPVHSLEPDP